MKTTKSILFFATLAVLAPFSSAETDPALVPSLVDMFGSRSVVYDLSGGYPGLSVDVFPTAGWAFKHIGQPQYEDISMNVIPGTPGGPISFISRSCSLNRPVVSMSLTSPVSFTRALYRDCLGWSLSEFTIPACDVSGSDFGFINLKLTGGTSSSKGTVAFNPNQYSLSNLKQKAWLCSNFRLHITGVDCTRVDKIEAITVHQRSVDLNGDGVLDAVLVGSNLVCHLPLGDSAPFLMDLSTGGGSAVPPRTGRLDLLDDNGNVLNFIFFTGLQTLSASPNFNPKDPNNPSESVSLNFAKITWT